MVPSFHIVLCCMSGDAFNYIRLSKETPWVLFHGPPSWRNSEPGRRFVRELATGMDARLYNSTKCSANVSINGNRSINWYSGSAHVTFILFYAFRTIIMLFLLSEYRYSQKYSHIATCITYFTYLRNVEFRITRYNLRWYKLGLFRIFE